MRGFSVAVIGWRGAADGFRVGRRHARASFAAVIAIGCLALDGCNCGPTADLGGAGGGSGGGGGSGVGGSSAVGGGVGGSSGAGGGSGVGGSSGAGGGACAEVKATGSLSKKPVDIIFVIDNSSSMTAEIIGVQANINGSFAQIIAASGLDYRVIMLSKHGSATADQSICVNPPLSGNATCAPPAANPVNAARFFHYSTEIASQNSYKKILGTYNVADPSGQGASGWSQWLRPDAFKVFIVITDDNESVTAASFETSLFALTPKQFGTATARNYLLHSITGIAQKPNPADAYLPTEPKNNTKCSSAVNAGSNYQDLSITTGGLRFPVCDPSKFDTVFKTVADGVVAGAQVACEFTIPPPPAGHTLSNRIVVQYTPGAGGAVQSFTQVTNASMCMNSAFYVANGMVEFCPTTCTAVKADTLAKVDVLFTCEELIN